MKRIYLIAILSALLLANNTVQAQSLETTAKAKITELELLMDQAKQNNFDVTREETTVWFAYEFLKFANWDEAHKPFIVNSFEQFWPLADEKEKMGEEIPDFQRQEVIDMLNKSIETLTKVIDGTIVRRPVAKVDWKNITVDTDQFTSNGKPVFLYDYFSKSMGNPTSNTAVYNDHLGNIDHVGGFAPNMLSEDFSFNQYKLNIAESHPDTRIGYSLFWQKGIPGWIKDKEPELNKGACTFIDFDIDNPLMREIYSKILQKAGEVTKDRKTVQLGYILANEPHWFFEEGNWAFNQGEMTALSSYTIEKFKTWLKLNYDNNISELNTNWNTNFADFDAVTFEYPIKKWTKGTSFSYDFHRYIMDRGIEWFNFMQNELHKTNPTADTHIKIEGHFFAEDNRAHGIDLESLTEITTMIGDDAKTTGRNMWKGVEEPWEEHYAYNWESMCVAYDFMESVAPNKIHVNSEAHFLSTVAWRDLYMTPDYVRNAYWLATIHGMDASLSWFWARDPDGSPEARIENGNLSAPGMMGSFAASVNMQPRVANELTQVMMDMNSFSEEIMALRRQRRPLRLFHSETSAIKKTDHMSTQFKLYESLFFEGLHLGYVTEKILKKQDHQNWDVVLVYKTEYVTDAEFNALQNYLDNGGTIIIDNDLSLSKNEYGRSRSEKLDSGSGNIIKASSISEMKSEALASLAEAGSMPEITISEVNSTGHKGCTWKCIKNEAGNNILSIINLGKTDAKLNIKLKNAQVGTACKDLLNGIPTDSRPTLKPNEVYFVEVTDEKSHDVSVKGIGKEQKYNAKLFPNPSTGIFNIKLNSVVKNPKVIIYDINGSLIAQKSYDSMDKITCDIRDKNTGVYLVKLVTDNYTQPFIYQKK